MAYPTPCEDFKGWPCIWLERSLTDLQLGFVTRLQVGKTWARYVSE